ncbi:MAG: orotate phosphoribosyltransferase [Saprospiraceae bacterium]|jgi:orotate phosphoribosyltransferase|nr:orotate phosphoribosyltransferase [Saprospiraceae bacterium]
MNIAKDVAQRLLQIKAIKLSPQNPFTWASGLKSPIYCDNRIVLSYPEHRAAVIKAFAEQSASYPVFDLIAGVATAGIAHGALLAEKLNAPFIYVRSKAKAHGRQNQIEGDLKKGAKVLVIEDLISTGGSSIAAVEALRQAGAEVIATMAIFTYEFDKAQQTFDNANCPFSTLSNYTSLLEVAQEMKYISEKEVKLLKKWRQNPQEWSEAFSK